MALRRTSAWPRREPADRLRDPQNLLLVADDAVGLLEDRLEGRVQIRDRLLAELGLDELGDERHRARPIERDDSREFPHGVRLELDDVAAHPRAFELEDAVGVAPAEHLEGLRVVERDIRGCRCRCRGARLTFLTALARIVRFARPRKSILSRPTFSMSFLAICATNSPLPP